MLPIYARDFWKCVCGVFVPPAYCGVCSCGHIHPELAAEFAEYDTDDDGSEV